jgi:ABC-type Zn2+ transport system substrate-binding protein/surface adhesin
MGAAGFVSEAEARDEERRSMNGARETDMHRVRDHDHDQDHDHDHDHGPKRRSRLHIPAPARKAGPIMMVVALGWLVRQFLKRPKAGKGKRAKAAKSKRR